MEKSVICFNKAANFLFGSSWITDKSISAFIATQGKEKSETEKVIRHLLNTAQFMKIDDCYFLLANGSLKRYRRSRRT